TAAGRRGDRPTSGMSAPVGYRFGDEQWRRGDVDATRSPVADRSGAVLGQWGRSSSSFAGSCSRRFSASLGSRRSPSRPRPRGAQGDEKETAGHADPPSSPPLPPQEDGGAPREVYKLS